MTRGNDKEDVKCPVCGAKPVVEDTCPKDCGSLEGMIRMTRAQGHHHDDVENDDNHKYKPSRLFGYDWASGFVAPFLGVSETAGRNALQAAKLTEKDSVVDLGSGDGRICRIACELGVRATGYDLDEGLIYQALNYNNTERICHRNDDNDKTKDIAPPPRQSPVPKYFVGDLFEVALEPFSVITMFLLPETTTKLATKLKSALAREVRIVSFGWQIPELGIPSLQYDRENEKASSQIKLVSRWFVYSTKPLNYDDQ
jgi:hypothetical protein